MALMVSIRGVQISAASFEIMNIEVNSQDDD